MLFVVKGREAFLLYVCYEGCQFWNGDNTWAALFWIIMCQWPITARVVTWWNVLRVQNTSPMGEHEATGPSCFVSPFLSVHRQGIQVHPRPERKREPCVPWRRATCTFNRNQERKVWLQERFIRHGLPEVCCSFTLRSPPPPPSACSEYLSSGKSSRIPLRTMAHLLGPTVLSELFSCLYFPHDRTPLRVGTILLYSLLHPAKYFPQI